MLAILTTIFWFLLVITIIIFIHEMGHLVVARMCGVFVEEFSIGFGKELYSYKCKQGTKWKISAIPLGGYVRFFGDATVFSSEDKEKLDKMNAGERKKAFYFKATWQKFLIVLAGPLANYLTAIFIFAALFTMFGKVLVMPKVTEIIDNSPAMEAGLEVGDLITHANDTPIQTMKELYTFIVMNQEKPIKFTIERGAGYREEDIIDVTVTPKLEEVEYSKNIVEKVPRIGILANESELIEFNIMSGAAEATKESYILSVQILKFLGQMITGERSLTQIGGPITVAKYSDHSAKQGFYAVLIFIALISINIGLFNLLPIPIVDGGHLAMYAFRMMTGREIPQRVTKLLYFSGGIFLAFLMAFVIISDVIKLM